MLELLQQMAQLEQWPRGLVEEQLQAMEGERLRQEAAAQEWLVRMMEGCVDIDLSSEQWAKMQSAGHRMPPQDSTSDGQMTDGDRLLDQ